MTVQMSSEDLVQMSGYHHAKLNDIKLDFG